MALCHTKSDKPSIHCRHIGKLVLHRVFKYELVELRHQHLFLNALAITRGKSFDHEFWPL